MRELIICLAVAALLVLLTPAVGMAQGEPTPKCANPAMIWPACTPRGNSFSDPGSVGGGGAPWRGGGGLLGLGIGPL